jgi:hypothetical protein
VARRLRPGFTGLSWYGGRRPALTGGLVAAIGLNQRLVPALAVDPEGTVPAPVRKQDLPSGPQLTVEAVMAPPDPQTTRVGRFRLPKG